MFGATGVSISKLCLGGGSFTGADSEALLDEALRHGVDCWEIVSFTGRAYVDYFEKYPETRERVFLSGKVSSTNPAVMQEQLHGMLSSNGISTVDFLAIHAVDNVAVLTDEVRRWAEKVKKEKKIRFFGFCTHRNMSSCLGGAADLGWIDGVQTVYNYRLQNAGNMEDALQRCHDRGIGIFAVKSMGLCVQRESELQGLPFDRGKLTSLSADRDMSFEQAKLKAIWQNPHLTSICSLMPTSAILQSNAAAARNERPLNAEIDELLREYADITGRYFCSRCGLCETVNADRIPILHVMEMLMYFRVYGMKALVAKMFAQIPLEIRNKMNDSDYSMAEETCPQRMPIAQLMKEALAELGNLQLRSHDRQR
jgi:hypothetical protein